MPRQLLHLSVLAEAIAEFDEPERLALAMACSDHLTTNCMLTSYAAGWRRLTPLFSVRAFRHVPRPVELNPWMDGTGRGSFPNAVRKLMRARAFARSPKEPTLDGGFRDVPAVTVDTAHQTTHGNARDLSFLSSASVDLVLNRSTVLRQHPVLGTVRVLHPLALPAWCTPRLQAQVIVPSATA